MSARFPLTSTSRPHAGENKITIFLEDDISREPSLNEAAPFLLMMISFQSRRSPIVPVAAIEHIAACKVIKGFVSTVPV